MDGSLQHTKVISTSGVRRRGKRSKQRKSRKVLMGQNDDHIGQEDDGLSRSLKAVKSLYELGNCIGGYKLLSVLGYPSPALGLGE